MKHKKEIKVNTAFMVEPSVLDKIDYYAAKIGVSRSSLIRNMIDTSLSDLKIMDKTGTLKAASSARNFLNILKDQMDNEKGLAI